MAEKGRMKFVVPGDEPIQIQDSPHLARLEPYGDLVVYKDRPASMEEQLRRVENAEVIINTRGAVKWFRPALESLPDLRMIATCSIGTDMIDLEAASELGIVVSNQPGRIAPIVGEHIVALMFAAAKRMAFQTSELKAGRWTRMENIFLQGKTLGLIGTGNVGREVARLANALGMEVIAWTFNPTPEREEALGVRFVELDDLLACSDVVSIQVRLSDDSRRMVGQREFELMKPGALFINGGRGELIDTAALIQALDSGHLAGAGLDVFDQEPLAPDDPVLACEQIVLTPHLADQTPEGMELLNEGAVSNVIAFLEGRPQNVANAPRPRD
jgi:phosphoglycerate dehydrogenase-like enzyme